MADFLKGEAAQAALRLMPPSTRRQMHVIATMLDIPVDRAVRQLVHVHKGDIDAYRRDSLDRVVFDARTGKLSRGPGVRTWQQMVDGKDDTEAARVMVEGILISKDTPFLEYCEQVDLMLHGKEAE